MPDENTEKRYNELRKKYKLPDYKDVDFELEISTLETPDFLLREIIRRITEKLDFYSALIEEVLQPDAPKLYVMHESRHFDDFDKKKMFELYTKLMSFNRLSIQLSLEHDEKDEADYITSFFTEWEDIKNELLKCVKKMRDSWQGQLDIKEDIGYLG